MVALTHYHLNDGNNGRQSSSTSLVEETNYTISAAALATAGFSVGDNVIIIPQWVLSGISSTSSNRENNFGRGTTYGGRTDYMSSNARVEPQDTEARKGGRTYGWLERFDLVANENHYYSHRTVSGSSNVESDNFGATLLNLDELDAGDFRWAEKNTTGTGLSTSWTDAVSVTLPATPTGDDWVILAMGNLDAGGTTTNGEWRLDINGTTQRMTTSQEGEDSNEQMPVMIVYPHKNAGASDVVKLQCRNDSGSTWTLDEARIFALRLNKFKNYVAEYGNTPVSSSGTVDTWVEVESASLVLDDAGDVMVFAWGIFDASTTATTCYYRIQEGGSDIVTGFGTGGVESRDSTDFYPFGGHLVANLTSGTKTIDFDFASYEVASASNHAQEYCIVAFSLELAAAAAPSGSIAIDVPAMTMGLVGGQAMDGQAALTMPAIQAAFSASVGAIQGQIDVSVGAITVAIDGAQGFPGAADLTLAPVAVAMVGQQPFAGQVGVTMSPILADLVGQQPFAGQVGVTMSPILADLVGRMEPDGQAALTMPAIQATFAGAIAEHVGMVDVTVGQMTLSVNGEQPHTGSLGIDLSPASVAFLGNALEPHVGSIGIDLSPMTMEVSGYLRPAGVVGIDLNPITVAFSGVFGVMFVPGVGVEVSAIVRPLDYRAVSRHVDWDAVARPGDFHADPDADDFQGPDRPGDFDSKPKG